MFRLKSAAVVALIAVSFADAEDETLNLFGSVGLGFGMGGERYTSTETVNNNTTVKDKFFNYGSGFKADVGCQYFLMEDVALQPSFSYSGGIPFKTYTTVASLKDTWTYHRHVFGIKAAVVPRFEVLDLLDMYVGAGLGFFWSSQHFQRVVDVGVGTQKASGKITALPTFGFNGSLGADYPLNDELTLFAECGFEQMRFKLKKRIVKESNITGFNEGTTFYSKNDANPDNLSPVEVPGSNFQIRIGVRYALK